MENENIEIVEELIEENEEIIETVEETIPGTDTSREEDITNNSTDVVTSSDSSSNGDSNQTLEELLREYFSSSRELSSFSEEGSSNSIASEGVSKIDYTQLLEEILQSNEDCASIGSSLYQYYQEYDSNNNLQSGVDDISLTNTLLLLVFIGLLASATLGLLRRIT